MDKTYKAKLVQYGSSIDYADGSEKELLRIVDDPAFDEATAWQGAKGWAQYYHLSPLRANLLSWMDFGGRPLRILELGAGCGAITAHLVTVPSAHVVAVEGSLDRAKVIQARCANAANLEVHACPIDRYVPDTLFDIVTLIGVLEYAGKYEQADDPFEAVLLRAAGWLKSEGILVIAIENQLGVKYLSGTAEDHYGTAFEGVNGYPHYNGVRTFTTATLEQKLRKTGFSAHWWLYPYPDYKLPSVVFSKNAFDDTRFDWCGLVDIPPEPNENQNPLFSDRMFLKLAQENGTLHHFMNSFLVIAARQPECLFVNGKNETMVAARTNVKFRGRPFQTVTVFSASGGALQVEKRRLNELPYSGAEYMQHRVTESAEPYHMQTVNLFDAIADAIAMTDAAKLTSYCRLWIDLLLNHAAAPTSAHLESYRQFSLAWFDRILYEQSFEGGWLPGEYLDLTPLNIIFNPQNPVSVSTAKIIDLEWQCSMPIPLQLVFDRGYILLVTKLQRLFQPHKIRLHPESGLPQLLHEVLNAVELTKRINLPHSRIFETWFQKGVIGGSFEQRLDWTAIASQLETPSSQKPISFSFAQFTESIAQLVKKGSYREAMALFDKYRHQFSSEPQLKEFEDVMKRLRQQLAR